MSARRFKARPQTFTAHKKAALGNGIFRAADGLVEMGWLVAGFGLLVHRGLL
jgi:type IV secretory pathway TrbD component